MYPVKVEVDWITDSKSLIHPCEKETYEHAGSKEELSVLHFCYPFSDSDSEFARFLTRVAQNPNQIPEAIQHQINGVIVSARRLIAVIADLESQGVDLELLEQLTDIYGIATLEKGLEDHLNGENPRVIRFVLMHNMKLPTYTTMAQKTNQRRSEELKKLQQ